MSDPDLTHAEAVALQAKTVADGSAFEKLKRITELQGGDPHTLDDLDAYPKAKHPAVFRANTGGYLAGIDTMALGFAGIQLGAGRRKLTDPIDYSSGMFIHARLGDEVSHGDKLLSIFAESQKAIDEVVAKVSDYFSIQENALSPPPLILERID